MEKPQVEKSRFRLELELSKMIHEHEIPMSRVRVIIHFHFKGRTMFKQLKLDELNEMHGLLHEEFVNGNPVKPVGYGTKILPS